MEPSPLCRQEDIVSTGATSAGQKHEVQLCEHVNQKLPALRYLP